MHPEFDVDLETACRDAESLVSNLASLGILQLSSEPALSKNESQ